MSDNISANVIALCAVLVAVASIIFTLTVANRSNYVNNITGQRIKFRGEIRDSLSKFCGIIKWFLLGGFASTEADKILLEADQLYFLITLKLDSDHKFDRIMLTKMREIITELKPNIAYPTPLEDKLAYLVSMTKALLDYEWQLAKIEAKKGYVKEKWKDEMSYKYLKKFIDAE
ncbi:MAG: hypothetical protein JWQ09_882 [Segetibacter sp.]|nr:hypothetical protein [Segetibacter sp.]